MNKNIFLRVDWWLLTPVIILLLLSLTTLFSININMFRSQLIFIIFSFFVFLFFSQTDYRIIQHYSIPVYIISICLLALIFIVGIETRGAVRWLDIMGLRIQFSEILKPFLVLCLSSFVVNRMISFKTFLLSMCFLSPIALLIFLQPDLGSTIIYVATTILGLFIIGFSMRIFIVGLLTGISVLPIVWQLLHDYQRQRILTFMYPTKDPLGTSYNAVQSIIAVGSGMFLGKGLSESTQSGLWFLPERHTDFIFATLSEGLGFIGAALVIISFIMLLYRVYVIYSSSDDLFPQLFTSLSFSLLFIQAVFNIGMNIGILPIVGVTLPFVSYGGSSLLSNFILLGFLSSIHAVSKQRNVLEIR